MTKFAGRALLAISLLLATAPATTMTVQPVVINLTTVGPGHDPDPDGREHFRDPAPRGNQGRGAGARRQGVQGTGKDPGDLLVFPPQAMIQPGQTQTFRVQYVGDPDLAQSKHYYVTVAQLPVKLPEGQSAIQILYNFQVLVSVAPLGAKPADQDRSRGDRQECRRQAGGRDHRQQPSNAHGYLSQGRLRIVQRDAAGKKSSAA